MLLKDAKESMHALTGAFSDVNRKACFAGLAVVWIFAIEQEAGSLFTLRPGLYPALTLFVVALALDLGQYLWGGSAWTIFFRRKQSELVAKHKKSLEANGLETEQLNKAAWEEARKEQFTIPGWVNTVTASFFWAKAAVSLAGFAVLLFTIFRYDAIATEIVTAEVPAITAPSAKGEPGVPPTY